MRYRFAMENGASDDLNAPDSDDQRTHPRGGTIEKIADIAYDALRKHEIEPTDKPEKA